MTEPAAYIRSPHQQCLIGGCQFLPVTMKSVTLLQQAERLMNNQSDKTDVQLTPAAWCHQGQHPFDSLDPEAENWTRTGRNQDGSIREIPWTVCGSHVKQAQELQEKTAAAALPGQRLPSDAEA
jgi:hypothetical protein